MANSVFIRLKRRGRATMMPICAKYEVHSDTYVAELSEEHIKDLLDPSIPLLDEPADYVMSG